MRPNGRSVDLARRSWRSADEHVIRWRRAQLLRAGFEDGLAAGLAGDCGVDLHALIELVEAGCPPRLAARILAPLDDESRPC